jgi:hypothetical protein
MCDRPSEFKKTGRACFSLMDLWVSGKRNSFLMTDFNPIPLGERGCVSRDTFNCFFGYRISREKAENGGSPDLIINFIKELVGNDCVVYEYLFQWMAFLLQNPADIPGVMLCLHGWKGVGKTLLYQILVAILGEINCTSIADMDHLVGQFNGKRQNKKLVVLEEIGSTVYDPKNWGKIKDMITNPTQGFNNKHKAIEDAPAPTGFIQLTNDDHCVRVDDNGVHRIYLVKCSNYWSYKQCQIDGRVEERKKKFQSFTRDVFSDREGCLSGFANYLYQLPLKKEDGRFVRLEHYNPKCPAMNRPC